MSTRSVILEKAAALLAESTNGDVSTRAVCEAAGVTQPVLYRYFGDKEGLLVAVVDHVWSQYLQMKRAAGSSPDPLTDLYNGWDSHVAFALAHPHAYRLLFGTTLWANTDAADEAMSMLRQHLERLATQGRLRIQPTEAARLVMAANSGVALALLLRKEQYPDLGISSVMRDSLYASLLTGPSRAEHPDQALHTAATTLRAGVPALGAFSEGEASLLDEWLARVQLVTE